MKKDSNFYTAVFVAALVVSNILSAKLIAVGPFVLPSGIICYAVTYLMSDVIHETFGKEEAERTVWYGMYVQVICSILITIAVAIPGIDSERFDAVLGVHWISILGSLLAYILSQSVDLILFQGIRTLLKRNGKYKWVWNNASTIASQTIDTIVYVGFTFGLGYGYFFTDPLIVGNMVVSQIIAKTVLALCDTPFFYFLTGGHENGSNNNQHLL